MLVRDAPLITHLSEDDIVEDLQLLGAARRHDIPSAAVEGERASAAPCAGSSLLQSWIKPPSSWEACLDSLHITDLESYRAAMDVVDTQEGSSTNPDEFVQAWDHLMDLIGGEHPMPAPSDPEGRKAAATAVFAAAAIFFNSRMTACQRLLVLDKQSRASTVDLPPRSAIQELDLLVEDIRRHGQQRASELKRWGSIAGADDGKK